MNLGATEIMLILLVVLLLFGGKRLPDLARTVGKGLSEFKRATQEVQREINLTAVDTRPAPKPSPPSGEAPDDEANRTAPDDESAAKPPTSPTPPASDS